MSYFGNQLEQGFPGSEEIFPQPGPWLPSACFSPGLFSLQQNKLAKGKGEL